MKNYVELKQNAIKLRIEKRLSSNEIALKLNVSVHTVVKWIKPFKLTYEELKQRAKKAHFLGFIEYHVCEHCEKPFRIEMRLNKKGEKVPVNVNSSGRFCTRRCSNTKIQTEESNNKKRLSAIGNANRKGKRIHLLQYCKICNKILSYANKTGYCHKHFRLRPGYCESISKANKGKTGGLRHGTSRAKRGWYKGYYCDSSWELAYVVYNLEHDIPFERNKSFFEYEYNGKKHKYYPDFIENKQYVEVKGYLTEQNKSRHAVVADLKILDKKEIQPYLEYVKSKYGNQFINLYEDKLVCRAK